jgi:hypothetical protein
LIFAESASGIVQREVMNIRIVAELQPYVHYKSCAIDDVVYAKRKGANHRSLNFYICAEFMVCRQEEQHKGLRQRKASL